MTVSARPSWAWVACVMTFVLLATLTPQGGPSVGDRFFGPLLPERPSQWNDVAQNVLLYLPVGLLLGIGWFTALRTVAFALAASLTIELVQFVIPGRDPILRDVLTNTTGASIGWAIGATRAGTFLRRLLVAGEGWLVRCRNPDRQTACRLCLAWVTVVVMASSVSAWLLAPALPPPLFFGVASPAIDQGEGAIRIGSDGSGWRVFEGAIDEVRIYARARSAEEIASDMRRPVANDDRDADLKAAYGFDADHGASVVDGSVHARTGVAHRTTWTATGRFGGALSFDGQTSEVLIPDGAFDLSRGLTIEAWIFPARRLRDDVLVIGRTDDAFFLRGSSYRSPIPLAGVKFAGAPRMISPRRSLPVRQWSHLALTYDGRVLRLYVDATLAGVFAHWSTHQPSRAVLNGSPLPTGIVSDPRRLSSTLLGEFTLDLTITCGEPQPVSAPVFLIAGIQSINALEVLAAGSELRIRFPRKARRLGLVPADHRMPEALQGCAPGEDRQFLVEGPLQRARLYDAAGHELRGERPDIASAWRLGLDSQLLPVWLVAVLSFGYLGVLVAPIGYWFRVGVTCIAALGITLAGLFAIPAAWGLPTLSSVEMGAVFVGMLAGTAIDRRRRRRPDFGR